eukprot:485262_1
MCICVPLPCLGHFCVHFIMKPSTKHLLVLIVLFHTPLVVLPHLRLVLFGPVVSCGECTDISMASSLCDDMAWSGGFLVVLMLFDHTDFDAKGTVIVVPRFL